MISIGCIDNYIDENSELSYNLNLTGEEMSKVYRHSDGSYRDYPELPQESMSEQIQKMISDINEIENLGAFTVPTKPISLGMGYIEYDAQNLPPNIKIEGTKHDSNKPRTELIPTEFTIEVAKALTFGANKYSEDNFKNGISYRRLLGAAKRHIELELCKIESDSESDLSHLAHAGASLAMYAFMKTHRTDLDDRYEYTEEQKKKIEEMMYGEKK